MNHLIHGDNIVSSRQKLTQLISAAKKQGVKEVIKLNGKNLSETDLRLALETQSFFTGNKLVIIENLLTRPRSKLKSLLVDITSKERKTSLILWDGKIVTKTWLNQLPSYQALLFKTPTAIFNLLDKLKPQNARQTLTILHNGLKYQSSELIFYMLSRRVSDLIIAQDSQADSLLKGAPWQKGKLKSQTKSFSLDQLINLHDQLLDIDESIKTGKALMPLSSQLDLLLAKI